MKPFPTDFVDQTTQLNADLLDQADAELLQKFADKGYQMHIGLTETYAHDIAKICQQPSIKEYCPNDSSKRFMDLEATKNWLAKGRAMFLLIRSSDLQIVGYGWTGAEISQQVPNGQTTFALRISETDQGQGLATPFARLIVAAGNKIYQAQDFWLETWQSDAAAVHIYHKLGFKGVGQNDDMRPTAAGQQIADTRLYMSLPNDKL